MSLTKEQFLTKKGGQTEEVPVGVGETVLMVRPTTRMIREWRLSLIGKDGKVNKTRDRYSSELFAASLLVDESGKRWFTDDEVLSGAFDELDGAVVERITRVAYEWSGRGDVEQPAKNSEAADENASSGDASAEAA